MNSQPTGARSLGRGGKDDGFALLTVLVTMALLTILVTTSVALAANNIQPSRQAQDSKAAMAAAQTALDDYTSRLNNCDTYWSTPCPGSPPETASTTVLGPGNWATVPGGKDGSPAKYRYTVLLTPASTDNVGGVIRLKADGQVNGVQRSITTDLRKAGFLEFIYYTEKESSDPASLKNRYYPRVVDLDAAGSQRIFGVDYVRRIQYSGLSDAEAAKCSSFWYDTPGLPGRASRGNPVESSVLTFTTGTQNYNWGIGCEIQFTGGDVINGPLYTKDAILLNTRNGKDPEFKKSVETLWPLGSNPAPRAAKPWRESPSGSKPAASGNSPKITDRTVTMPPSNDKIRLEAVGPGKEGCLYSGPTELKFRDDGQIDVRSPATTATNSRCGTGKMTNTQTVRGPGNGVIYVDSLPPSTVCTGKVLGKYPVDGDITQYSCKDGDVFVEGKVNGKFTVASADRIVVTNNLTYSGGHGRDSDDVLGLVAGRGNVEVYHPVGCVTGDVSATRTCFNELYKNLTGSLTDVEVDGALLSVDHSVTVQNFEKGPKLGYVTVVGGIYQRYRGAVGTGGDSSEGTGYYKNYIYDDRLIRLPPPYFLKPTEDPWLVAGFSEK